LPSEQERFSEATSAPFTYLQAKLDTGLTLNRSDLLTLDAYICITKVGESARLADPGGQFVNLGSTDFTGITLQTVLVIAVVTELEF
jgi:hypothetical protein